LTDDLQKKREGVAEEYGIAIYRQYSEKQAAPLIGTSYDTLKRKRKQGKIPYVDRGGESVGYMGFMLIDFILFGEKSVDQDPPERGVS
jgi:hypothetical protein